jgi:hypothetical protein
MAANDNILKCSTSLSFIEAIGMCLGKMADGKVYLRTHKITPVAGSKAFSCSVGMDEEAVRTMIMSCLCEDSNGDVAIRISQTT